MRFRPCIDIHNGKVKQIVGSSLRDEGDYARENFVSEKDAAYYALMYGKMGFTGGHIIILNPKGSEFYEASKEQALAALSACPGSMMIGGSVDPSDAPSYIKAGASHVIVTSYIFTGSRIDSGKILEMEDAVGREHLCIDLSCRRKDDGYVVVTNRWQTFTDEVFGEELLDRLSRHACEYLVHAVDAEGKQKGIEEDVIPILKKSPIPVTYAGGIRDLGDVGKLKVLGDGKIDLTIGSALKIFGGNLGLEEISECIR